MKNEIDLFFSTNEDNLEKLLNESKMILEQNVNNNSTDAFILIHLLSYMNEEEIKKLQIRNESIGVVLTFYQEMNNRIKNYILSIDKIPKLIDFEWKFILLNNLSNEESIPKILLKLIYSNGLETVIETDFANFKKLQEEIEECLSSYNSVYSRRIETFAK